MESWEAKRHECTLIFLTFIATTITCMSKHLSQISTPYPAQKLVRTFKDKIMQSHSESVYIIKSYDMNRWKNVVCIYIYHEYNIEIHVFVTPNDHHRLSRLKALVLRIWQKSQGLICQHRICGRQFPGTLSENEAQSNWWPRSESLKTEWYNNDDDDNDDDDDDDDNNNNNNNKWLEDQTETKYQWDPMRLLDTQNSWRCQNGRKKTLTWRLLSLSLDKISHQELNPLTFSKHP